MICEFYFKMLRKGSTLQLGLENCTTLDIFHFYKTISLSSFPPCIQMFNLVLVKQLKAYQFVVSHACS